MKGQGFVGLVDHGQPDAATLGLVQQLAVFLPTVQHGQGVELSFDGPIGANHEVRATQQPDAHDALQEIGPFQPVGQI